MHIKIMPRATKWSSFCATSIQTGPIRPAFPIIAAFCADLCLTSFRRFATHRHKKVIAVTGAGQGLGRAMAVYLASKGARLAIIDLDESHMAETLRQVEAAGSTGRSYVCNVAKEDQVEATFTAISA